MYSIDVLDKCFNCIILCFITPTQIAMYLIYFHSFCAHTFTHTHTNTHIQTHTHMHIRPAHGCPEPYNDVDFSAKYSKF